jgi:hypothetical protein
MPYAPTPDKSGRLNDPLGFYNNRPWRSGWGEDFTRGADGLLYNGSGVSYRDRANEIGAQGSDGFGLEILGEAIEPMVKGGSGALLGYAAVEGAGALAGGSGASGAGAAGSGTVTAGGVTAGGLAQGALAATSAVNMLSAARARSPIAAPAASTAGPADPAIAKRATTQFANREAALMRMASAGGAQRSENQSDLLGDVGGVKKRNTRRILLGD